MPNILYAYMSFSFFIRFDEICHAFLSNTSHSLFAKLLDLAYTQQPPFGNRSISSLLIEIPVHRVQLILW